MKPNKENIITEILIEIEKGFGFNHCQDVFGLNWALPPTTFKRYWKIASQRYREQQLANQNILAGISLEAEKERLKKAILTKDERMEILSQIARGEMEMTKHIVCDGVIQEREIDPAWNDRKNAIAELNKMDGSYSPIQTDIMSGGEKLNAPIFNIILDNDENEIF